MLKKTHMLRLLVLLFLFSGCGLRPLYSNSSYNKHLSHIQVEPITSIAGAELYHNLLNLFPLSNNPKYLLRIKFKPSVSLSAIDKSAVVLRESVDEIVEYKLLDKATGKVLDYGTFNNNLSYSKNLSAYTSYVEEEKSLENLTRYAAEEIRIRLMLYFEKHNL